MEKRFLIDRAGGIVRCGLCHGAGLNEGSSHPTVQHQLTKMRAQAHMFVGLQHVSQKVSRIDDGLNIARYDSRPYAITNGTEATRSLSGVESA